MAYGKTEKRCSRCGETKPLDAFYAAKHTPDGRQGWCRECSRANLRTWRATRGLTGRMSLPTGS